MSWTVERVTEAATNLVGRAPDEICAWALQTFGSDVGFAFSGAEDVVIIDLLSRAGLPFRVFTLDTWRLHDETYAFIERVGAFYNLNIEWQRPAAASVDGLVTRIGYDGFFDSIDNRKECCRVRKVAPLQAHLAGLDAWITGLRRDQAATRDAAPVVEWDEANGGLVKINPIAAWDHSRVWDEIRRRSLPYNALHDQAFPSIGCRPCTRAVAEDEDIRAGRWWWEQLGDQKECGLHIDLEGAK